MTFKIFDKEPRENFQQSFDKETITLEIAGKTINQYERIQEAREDTEIYPVLEKYNCIDKLGFDPNKTIADVREVLDLRNAYDQQHEAEKLWLGLPLEIRAEFGHSQKEFLNRGEQWLQNKIEENEKKLEISGTANKTIEQETGVVNNE